jgi:hypothetical protein
VTFTDQELWAAVRSAGSDGQSFTCATVRECLGMSSKKRHELAQFRDRFRAFRLAAGEGIEKVGKSAYRLKAAEVQEAPEAMIELEVIVVADDAPEAEVAFGSAPEAASAPEVTAPEPPAEKAIQMLEHPVAVEDADLGFGEPMAATAADSGELAGTHVIFSAWPESMQPTAASDVPAEAAFAPTEAQIEAEVRELVAAEESPAASLREQAEQAVARTWRDRGHWLGRRFAELFSRN